LPVGNGMPEVDDYGRNALDFIEAIETLGTTDAVMNAMEKAFGRFGFETIILAGLPNPDQRFEQLVLAKRWPAEWFKTYTANNYIRDDPTVLSIRSSGVRRPMMGLKNRARQKSCAVPLNAAWQTDSSFPSIA
jgi:hypothetical protein